MKSNTQNNTTTLLLSTAYLPPLEYMACLLLSDNVIVDIHETYPKQSWRNRCRILAGNGPSNLIIPVKKPDGNHTKTKDVVISNHEDWQKRHWKSLVSAYGNAPYFFYYKDLFAPFYLEKQEQKLWKLNYNMLIVVLDEMDMQTNIGFSEVYAAEQQGALDMRNAITPKAHRQSMPFSLVWEPYQQVFSDRHRFNANLSIIDLLFNLGPDAKAYLTGVVRNSGVQPREG